MILLSSFFCFIGGGGVVFTSIVYVMVADVVPDAERATVFFRIGASVLVGEMIASPLSAILMEIDPWLSIFLGLATMCSCGIVVALMPETLGLRTLEVTQDGNEDDEDSLSTRDHLTGSGLSNLKNAAHFIWGNTTVMILLFTYLLTTFGRIIQEMLLQYATKRYGWTWSKAAYLISLRAGSTLFLLLVVLPAFSYYLVTTLSFATIRKDLWLARISVILLSIGAMLIAFSATPILLTIGLVSFSLGGGYSQVIRSLLTSIVEPHFVGTLYNTIAMAETIGLILAGPLLASAFKKGLELGGAWIGMPFMVAAVLFLISTVAVFLIRLPDAPPVVSADLSPGSGTVVERPEEV
ncbi:MFS transporter [Phlyctema vagabunda]|uniref:MFS transporter n=1 Tax=Phlyctema vagabunda TaxID=108571 RepID=A0ABR4P219_9HELO